MANRIPRGVLGAFVVVGLLHLSGWGLLLIAADYSARVGAITLGTGLLAYMLGLRHAFDADHIAAIDNATRRLVDQGTSAGSVGLYFSLGHSTVVFTISALIALGLSAIGVAITSDHSPLRSIGGAVGAIVSGSFLILIALLNIVVLFGLIKSARAIRDRTNIDDLDERTGHLLEKRGVLNRLFQPVAKTVDQPWKMYPLGVLFGLGFDTASSVAVLAIAGGSAVSGGNSAAVIALPLVFAAGMSLGDTADGFVMQRVYGWANGHSERRMLYNMVVTSISIIAALCIGVPVLGAAIANQFGLTGGVWELFTSFDFEYVGFILVGVFLTTWALAWLLVRARQSERRSNFHAEKVSATDLI